MWSGDKAGLSTSEYPRIGKATSTCKTIIGPRHPITFLINLKVNNELPTYHVSIVLSIMGSVRDYAEAFHDCVCRPYHGHLAGLRRPPWCGRRPWCGDYSIAVQIKQMWHSGNVTTAAISVAVGIRNLSHY